MRRTWLWLVLFLGGVVWLVGCSSKEKRQSSSSYPPPTYSEPEHYNPNHTGEIREELIVLPGETEPMPITFEVIDGLVIYQGDIVLGKVDDLLTPQSIVIREVPLLSLRWSDSTVPYEIDPKLGKELSFFYNDYPDLKPDSISAEIPTMRDVVLAAIEHWQVNTNLTFVELNENNRASYPDFIRFVEGAGCSSKVGRQGGMQLITLANNDERGCEFGATVHEIGHAIGLFHEQSRYDRQKFVDIKWENIRLGEGETKEDQLKDYRSLLAQFCKPGQVPNLEKRVCEYTLFGNENSIQKRWGRNIGEYDYYSIMHYGHTAFGKEITDAEGNKKTLTTIEVREEKKGGVRTGCDIYRESECLGQRVSLSFGDETAVNELYSSVPDIDEPNPSTLDFTAPANIPTAGFFTFTNVGTQPLEYILHEEASWLEFDIATQISGTLDLNENKTVQVNVICSNDVDELSASIAIKSNDPNEPEKTVVVNLTCTAADFPPRVTEFLPTAVIGSDERQWLTILGENFAEGAVVTLRSQSDSGVFEIPPGRTEFVSSEEIRVHVNVTTQPDTWTAQVTNPDGQASNEFEFRVQAGTDASDGFQASVGTANTYASGALGTAFAFTFELPDLSPSADVSLTITGPEDWNGGRPFILSDAYAFKASDLADNLFLSAFSAVRSVSGNYTAELVVGDDIYMNVTVVDAAERLEQPENIELSVPSLSALNVTWSPVPGAASYFVDLLTQGDSGFSPTARVYTNQTSVTLSPLELDVGKRYEVRVSAHSIFGESGNLPSMEQQVNASVNNVTFTLSSSSLYLLDTRTGGEPQTGGFTGR